MCLSCQLRNKCTHCVYIIGQEVDLYSLILYTKLSELWSIFQNIIAISPISDSGFTLVGANVYLNDYNLEGLQVTHYTFWKIMIYFLNRVNEKFMERKKMKLAQMRGK